MLIECVDTGFDNICRYRRVLVVGISDCQRISKMDRKLRFIAGTVLASSYTMTLSMNHAHRRPAGVFGREG